MLIVLPGHLAVSGVTTWAARAVRLLREAGEPAGLLVHAPGGDVPEFLRPFAVGVVDDPTPIDRLGGRLNSLIPIYRAALDAVCPADGSPAVAAPIVPGDCHGVFAAISQAQPESVRVVSWIHADNSYDLRVAAHYEPMLAAIVGVSSELAGHARAELPRRADDIVHIPNAVAAPPALPQRDPLGARPVRLVYTGRLAEEQKRVSALPAMLEALEELGIDCEQRLVGDGPARRSLEASLASYGEASLIGAVAPERVAEHLDWADVWVLPSRYEGQSVAMLEAMACGCVPVVSDVGSGLSGCIEDGVTGVIAESDRDSSPERTGLALALAILRLLRTDIEPIRVAARERVMHEHSEHAHVERLRALIDRVRAARPRSWPTNRPAAFSGSVGAASGSTPADAAERLLAKLDELRGKKVAIFGAGRHTLDLASILAHSPAEIVGIIDDHTTDASLWGWPIVPPERAGELRASEVVISSAMHEDAIWSRRAVLEDKGLAVHRLYAA